MYVNKIKAVYPICLIIFIKYVCQQLNLFNLRDHLTIAFKVRFDKIPLPDIFQLFLAHTMELYQCSLSQIL